MKIVAIVPALNEAAGIAATVRALRREMDEVCVVDGGSTDETASLATAAGARVVHSTRGYAAQCNAGVKAVTAEVLFFIAADSVVGAGLRASIELALASPAVTHGGPWLRIADPAWVFRFVEFGGNFRAARHRVALPDQGLFVRSRVFTAMPESTIPQALLCHQLDGQGEFRLVGPATMTSSRKWRQLGLWKVAALHARVYRAFRRSLPENR